MEKLGKLLVVDDAPENIDLLINLLENEYEIKIASNGETAINIAQKTKPDLILLDILMPGIDGYETCRRLKTIAETKDIPVIFLTALSEVADKTKGFETGAVDYITKPFEAAEVSARVETHIELRKAKKEVQQLLSKTLSSTIQIMMELLAATNPIAFQKSSRIKLYVKRMVDQINPPDAWKIEIAGMLSQIGCVSISSETLEKIFAAKAVPLDEQNLFKTHPSRAEKLLLKIPRFEEMAGMVSTQLEPVAVKVNMGDVKTLGTQIINIAVGYEILVSRGEIMERAIYKMKQKPEAFNQEILTIFETAMKNPKVF